MSAEAERTSGLREYWLRPAPAVRYRGFRRPGKAVVVDCVVDCDDSSRGLRPRNDLVNHSPDGFEWGYGGSGPAQLALAILADCVGDRRALQHYQAFKWEVVASLPDEWTIEASVIREWVARRETVC